DILDAGEVHVEAGAEFEQGCNAAVVRNASVGRLQRAGDDLEQCGFAAAVWPNDACCCSGCDFKTHIAQSPKLAMPLPVATRKRFLQPIARTIVDAILFRDALHAQRYCHESEV